MKASLNELKNLTAGIVNTFDVSNIDAHLSFSEAGLDSLDTFSLFLKVEEKYGISIPEADIEKIKTFQDLLDYSNQKLMQTIEVVE